MIRPGTERVLLVGDEDRRMRDALSQASPTIQVTAVSTFFDAIAELLSNSFSIVLASAEPIERRPEAAVRTLREVAADARVILFGDPTLEPLSRKMMEFGCDQYLVSPSSPAELQRVLSAPASAATPPERDTQDRAPASPAAPLAAAPLATAPLAAAESALPLADLALDALCEHPNDPAAAAVRKLNDLLAPLRILYAAKGEPAPSAEPGRTIISHPIRAGAEDSGHLHLLLPVSQDANEARALLATLADLIGKLLLLQDRHNRLQKLAITDELTGLYNARYFRHFLERIMERSRKHLFPVTLFMFDIDNFKKYNDEYGHGVGDQILRETAALIRRCCREHDLVARLGGDEFAVVFWEKEGPRQPKERKAGGMSLRPPQTPEQVLERFKRLLARQEFGGLGSAGKGTLTISGGVAVFPYHANTMEELIALADRRLMFGAKKAGKNSIFLVGGDATA